MSAPGRAVTGFTESAEFYDALYEFKDYGAACERLIEVIRRLRPTARTLLDVACGTGRHLDHLRKLYAVEGLDLNPGLLAVARRRCPGVPLHLGDMTDFALGRRFDVVTCLFSSIGYVRTVAGLRAAISQMSQHLLPGGVLVVEPWFTPETYWVDRLTVNHVDRPDVKITWMYVSERRGRQSILDIHYLVGTPQSVKHLQERHELGLFTHEEHADAFRRAGLRASYDENGLMGRGMFAAIAPENSP